MKSKRLSEYNCQSWSQRHQNKKCSKEKAKEDAKLRLSNFGIKLMEEDWTNLSDVQQDKNNETLTIDQDSDPESIENSETTLDINNETNLTQRNQEELNLLTLFSNNEILLKNFTIP
ncbi:hypothetical protein FQR65_LT16226 [Abscondita terminalis]|nr:hypothetical protein FQR65_LT16226 [Abscondita terminalis]